MRVISTASEALQQEWREQLAKPLEEAAYAHATLCKLASTPVTSMALSGELYASKSGWLLLSVPNAVGRGFFAALDEPGVELPEDFNCHISVARPEELEAIGGVDKVTERGKRFHYNIGALKTVKPLGWDDISKVWFLSVTSSELQSLRKSYGLTPLPMKNGQTLAFHCTVAVRRKNVLGRNEVSKAASEISRYRCPHCGGDQAFNGKPGTDIRFRGGAECTSCGKGFSVCDPVGRQLFIEMQQDKQASLAVTSPSKSSRSYEIEICPHCKDEIREKSTYVDDEGYEWHRSCKQGPIKHYPGMAGLASRFKQTWGDEPEQKTARLFTLAELDTPGGHKQLAKHVAAPTPAQAKANNYKCGHLQLHGHRITIETAKGQVRSGVSEDGKKWSQTMQHHYGYFKGTESEADGDHIDCFVGDHPESELVFVVDQVNPKTGKFDEHKCMLGFLSEAAAREGYLANYEKGWKGLGDITPLTMPQFDAWAYAGNTKQPIAGQSLKKAAAERLLAMVSD